MQLTPHFSRAEFEHSDLAARFGIDNTCPEALLPNLQRLAEMLEEVRRKVGTVHITSGYRCVELNQRVGGAANSAHMTARAADIHVDGITPGALATYIRDSGLIFDKLLLEFPPNGWCHVQVAKPDEEPRRQTFVATATPRGTVYTPGLVVA